MTPLEHALALRAHGFSLFPVPPPRPGVPKNSVGDGKTPAIAWKAFQTRHATEAEIRRWFRTPQNVGIVTGALSDLVVVDADSPAGLRWCTTHLPYTPWQVQTSRGFHLYYRHPGVRVGNAVKLNTGAGTIAIDVRADGGYVVGPGSLHASGHTYALAGDWTRPRGDVPRFWPGWVAKPAPTHTTPPVTRPRPTGDITERARRYLTAIPRPEIGQGSDVATLSAACRLVRGFDLSEADATSLLWEWAGGRPGWSYAWVAAKVAHALRYGSETIGGLR